MCKHRKNACNNDEGKTTTIDENRDRKVGHGGVENFFLPVSSVVYLFVLAEVDPRQFSFIILCTWMVFNL